MTSTTPSTSTAELRKYELMVIFSGNLLEMDFLKELDELRKMLKESTKGVSHEENWGRRDLAYRVRKQKVGYYAVFNFSAEASAITELRNTIKLNPQVLRHLILILPQDFDPGRYKDFMLREEKSAGSDDRRGRAASLRPLPQEAPAAKSSEEMKKPKLAGKEEEAHLKMVEKKLEDILDNPDLDIK